MKRKTFSHFIGLLVALNLASPAIFGVEPPKKNEKKAAATGAKQTPRKASPSTLRFEGREGIEFQGVCVSPDGQHQQRIEGQVPKEIQLDYRIHSCKVKGKDKGIKLRLFQDRKEIPEPAYIPPRAGIEFVFTLPGKKRK